MILRDEKNTAPPLTDEELATLDLKVREPAESVSRARLWATIAERDGLYEEALAKMAQMREEHADEIDALKELHDLVEAEVFQKRGM